jgi:hypothetical protein
MWYPTARRDLRVATRRGLNDDNRHGVKTTGARRRQEAIGAGLDGLVYRAVDAGPREATTLHNQN